MIKYLAFVLLFCIPVISYAQQKKKIPVQVQSQMDKELAELEKEDPEMAEKLREIMKSSKGPTSSKPVKVAPEKKFISPAIPIKLKVPLAPPSQSQAKDFLLWYKGKRISENLLIQVDGSLVKFERERNRVVIQRPASKNPFLKVQNALQKSSAFKNKLIEVFTSMENGYVYYGVLTKFLNQIPKNDSSFSKLLENTIDLSDYETQPSKPSLGGMELMYSVEEDYEALMKLMAENPEVTIIEPPARTLDVCNECDPVVRMLFERKIQAFTDEMFTYESDLMGQMIKICRVLDSSSSPKKFAMLNAMDSVKIYIWKRVNKKIELLKANYGNDIRYMKAIIDFIALVAKQEFLFSGTEQPELNIDILKYLKSFDNHFVSEIRKNNFSTGLNIGFAMEMQQYKTVFGNLTEDISERIGEIGRSNRFQISMEVDFKMESEELRANGQARSEKKSYGMLIPVVESCSYVMYKTGFDRTEGNEDNYKIPLKVLGGIREMKVEDKWERASYTGPPEILSMFPSIQMDICDNQNPDTIKFSIFIYGSNENLASYAAGFLNKYSIDYMGFLNGMMYTSEIEEGAYGGEIAAKKWMGKAGKSYILNPSGNPLLDKMQDNYNNERAMYEFSGELARAIMNKKAIILYNAIGDSKVLADETAEFENVIEEMIYKGTIKFKIEYDPPPIMVKKKPSE